MKVLQSKVRYKEELDWILSFYNGWSVNMDKLWKLSKIHAPDLVIHFEAKATKGKDMLDRIGDLITYAAVKKDEENNGVKQ